MIIQVPLDRIAENPWQTRQVYDEAAIRELADDIERNDLLQPPVGRPVSGEGIPVPIAAVVSSLKRGGDKWKPEQPGFGVQIAVGHRRRLAMQLLHAEGRLKAPEMPIDIRSLGDAQMAVLAWSENEQRSDLTALEEALAIQRRMTDFGWTQEEAAQQLGIARSTVSNKLRLLKLPEEILQHLGAGKLTERQAAALLPVFTLSEEEIELAREHGQYHQQDLLRGALSGWSSDQIREVSESLIAQIQRYAARGERAADGQDDGGPYQTDQQAQDDEMDVAQATKEAGDDFDAAADLWQELEALKERSRKADPKYEPGKTIQTATDGEFERSADRYGDIEKRARWLADNDARQRGDGGLVQALGQLADRARSSRMTMESILAGRRRSNGAEAPAQPEESPVQRLLDEFPKPILHEVWGELETLTKAQLEEVHDRFRHPVWNRHGEDFYRGGLKPQQLATVQAQVRFHANLQASHEMTDDQVAIFGGWVEDLLSRNDLVLNRATNRDWEGWLSYRSRHFAMEMHEVEKPGTLTGLALQRYRLAHLRRLAGFCYHFFLEHLTKQAAASVGGDPFEDYEPDAEEIEQFGELVGRVLPQVRIEEARAAGKRHCRVCGCTDEDCSDCIEATGEPCHWVADDLCSRCQEETAAVEEIPEPKDANSKYVVTRTSDTPDNAGILLLRLRKSASWLKMVPAKKGALALREDTARELKVLEKDVHRRESWIQEQVVSPAFSDELQRLSNLLTEIDQARKAIAATFREEKVPSEEKALSEAE